MKSFCRSEISINVVWFCGIMVSRKVRMGKVAQELNGLIVGNVFDAPEVLEAYSVDQSILKITPKAVALPESVEDVRKLMQFVYESDTKISVTVRGTGYDEMGADLGEGIILSMEKLNQLLDIAPRERLVRVQAGMTLTELNTMLLAHGLTIPVEGQGMETIGELIANCPTDICSGRDGNIMKYVRRMEVVLSNGEVVQTRWLGRRAVARKIASGSLEGEIYRSINDLLEKNEETLEKITRENVSAAGYPRITQVKRGSKMSLMPLFFGADGTLGVVTEVILKAVPKSGKSKRVVMTFREFHMAQKYLELMKNLKPMKLEIYDIGIIRVAEGTGKVLNGVTRGMKSGFVIFAKFDRRRRASLKKVAKLGRGLPLSSQLVIEENATRTMLDEFENSLASFIKSVRSGERPPIATELYVPAWNLSSFINDVKLVESSLGVAMAVYGSYDASRYNIRPKFDVTDAKFAKRAEVFLNLVGFTLERQGGSVAGLPEGRVKAAVALEMMGEAEKKLYREIKTTFDAKNVLNPGAKMGADEKCIAKYCRKEAGKIAI